MAILCNATCFRRFVSVIRFAPVIIVGALAACSFEMPDLGLVNDNDTLPGKPPLAQLPPAPKPLYKPGDTYVFNDDGNVVQEQIVGVTPDRAMDQ